MKYVIPCKVSSGAFSGEFSVEIKLYDGSSYTEIVPIQYCWNHKKQRIEAEEVEAGPVEGLVAVRVLQVQDDRADVSFPGGEVVEVSKGDLEERPRVLDDVSV